MRLILCCAAAMALAACAPSGQRTRAFEARDAADERFCESQGLVPWSDPFMNCLRRQDEGHRQAAAAARAEQTYRVNSAVVAAADAAAAADFAARQRAATAPRASIPMPTSTDCRTVGANTSCTTY